MDRSLLRNLDKILLIVTFVIFIIGLFSIYSATHTTGLQFKISNFVFRQIVWMAASFAIFFIIISVDYQKFIDLAYIPPA